MNSATKDKSGLVASRTIDALILGIGLLLLLVYILFIRTDDSVDGVRLVTTEKPLADNHHQCANPPCRRTDVYPVSAGSSDISPPAPGVKEHAVTQGNKARLDAFFEQLERLAEKEKAYVEAATKQDQRLATTAPSTEEIVQAENSQGNFSGGDLRNGDLDLSDTATDLADDAESYRQQITLADEETLALEELEQKLDQSHSLSGKVLDQRGQGVGGMSISAFVSSLYGLAQNQPIPDSLRQQTVRTRADGSYQFVNLAQGEYLVRVNASHDYGPGSMLIQTGNHAATLLLSDKKGWWSVTGQVTSDNGEPLVNARVSLNVSGSKAAYTDADGYFEAGLVLTDDRNRIQLTVSLDGYSSKSIFIHDLDASPSSGNYQHITLQPTGATADLLGRISDSNDKSLKAVRVVARAKQSGKNHAVLTDNNGNFRIQGLDIQEAYFITIFGGDDYKDQTLDHYTLAAAEDELNIQLAPRHFASLYGQVLDLSGYPVPNIHLKVGVSGESFPPMQLRSDGGGFYRLDNIPASSLYIKSQTEPYYRISEVALSPGENRQLNIVLDAGGKSLAGMVTDEEGNPVPAAHVSLRWKNTIDSITAQSSRNTITNSQGYFSYEGLGAGQYEVFIKAAGYRTKRIDYDFESQGEMLTTKLKLQS